MKNRNKMLRLWTCAALGLAMLLPIAADATFVSPRRVMIEDKQRTASVNILNRTDKTMAYRFEWERRASSPTGDLIMLKESDPNPPNYQPADPYLQFSPRQVIVKPGESQTVRLLVRRPADLAQGEYRSNLLIKTQPLTDKPSAEAAPEPGLTGTLQLRTNLSIPIMVRQGETVVNFTVSNPAIRNTGGKDIISLDMQNDSTRSIYIKPELNCIDSAGVAKKRNLGSIRLFSEIKSLHREWEVPSDLPLGGCSSVQLKLFGLSDFQHKLTDPIHTINLR